jgi:hypothetical protein
MSEREQHSAPAREPGPRLRVEPRQAVDGDEVVRVEAVLGAKRERERD